MSKGFVSTLSVLSVHASASFTAIKSKGIQAASTFLLEDAREQFPLKTMMSPYAT